MIVKNKLTFQVGEGADEKTYVAFLGMGFLGLFLEATKTSLEDMSDKMVENPYKTVPEVLYWSLRYPYERKGEKFPFSMFDIAELIDEIMETKPEIINDFMKAFLESLQKGTKMLSGLASDKVEGAGEVANNRQKKRALARESLKSKKTGTETS